LCRSDVRTLSRRQLLQSVLNKVSYQYVHHRDNDECDAENQQCNTEKQPGRELDGEEVSYNSSEAKDQRRNSATTANATCVFPLSRRFNVRFRGRDDMRRQPERSLFGGP